MAEPTTYTATYYSYRLDNAADIKSIVMSGAGGGKSGFQPATET